MKITLKTLPLFVKHDGDCYMWVQSTNSAGYPQMRDGRNGGVMVKRYIYSELMGKPLKPKDRMYSICGNKACVNPDHLARRTYSETLVVAYKSGARQLSREVASRRKNGMKMSGSKVTPEILAQIRAEPPSVTHTAVAKKYGISIKSASRIRRGLTFRTTAPAASVFSLASTGSLVAHAG